MGKSLLTIKFRHSVPPARIPILLSYIALGIGIISLGFSAIFVRWAEAPGAVTSFYRMALGLLVQVLGYLAISYALGQLPASLVAPIMLGQPVVTAVLAGPLLGETLSEWEVVGGIAVLVGVYVVHHSRQKNSRLGK